MAKKNKGNSSYQQILNQWKYEIADELGIYVSIVSTTSLDVEFADELGSTTQPQSSQQADWGNITSREAGSIGGSITKRLIQEAQKTLGTL